MEIFVGANGNTTFHHMANAAEKKYWQSYLHTAAADITAIETEKRKAEKELADLQQRCGAGIQKFTELIQRLDGKYAQAAQVKMQRIAAYEKLLEVQARNKESNALYRQLGTQSFSKPTLSNKARTISSSVGSTLEDVPDKARAFASTASSAVSDKTRALASSASSALTDRGSQAAALLSSKAKSFGSSFSDQASKLLKRG
jgi:hypothetical protein